MRRNFFCTQLFLALAGAAFAQTETTASLMKQAIGLTAAGKLNEAEQAYRRLVQISPDDGYPALGRFYFRTGQTTKTEDLLNSAGLKAADALVQGRTAAAAGRASRAAQLLANTEHTTASGAGAQPAGREYARLVLLSNQLRLEGKTAEASDALTSAIATAGLSPVEQLDLLKKISAYGKGENIGAALRAVTGAAMSSRRMPYPQLRETVITAMGAVSASGTYATFHDQLSRSAQSPAEKWLLALSHIRKGDAESALAQLDPLSSATLAPGEQAIIMEELARLHGADAARSAELLRRALEANPPDADRICVELAQILYRQSRFDDVVVLLQPVKATQLDEAQQRIYKNLRLAVAGRVNEPAALLQQFEEQVKGLPWEKVRELAEAPLVYLQGSRYKELSALIDQRVQQPGAAPEILALKMSLENRLGNADAVVAALEQYLKLRPGDAAVVQEHADALAGKAYQLAIADPNTSPPAEIAKPAADAAARALWRAVELRPYLPENYAKLMELYRTYGEPDKARQVPLVLSKPTTATVEEIHSAALLLATNGYPEDALPLYERVLKQQPDNPKYRLNYAGALTRVGRFADADKIYYDLIRVGARGKQYHTHELYLYAFESARAQGKLEQFVAFLRELASQPKVTAHDTFLLDAGQLLKSKGRPQDAVNFFQTLIQNYPNRRTEAEDALLQAYVALGKFDEAEKMLAAQDVTSTNTEDIITREYNRAFVKSEKGDMEGAVKAWTDLAERFPRDPKATRSLLAAAQMQLQRGKMAETEKLLQQYLALDSGDVDAEQGAREMLARVRKKEVDPNVLIQSALEDAASAKK